jgi:hypothetical protein
MSEANVCPFQDPLQSEIDSVKWQVKVYLEKAKAQQREAEEV